MATSTAALVEGLRKRRAERAAASHAHDTPPEALEELRRLLLSVERGRLTRVEEGLSPEALGRALPAATLAARAESDAHARALAPTVVGAIRDAVESDPKPFVDAITPAMGPALRQAVAHALRAFVQQLQEALARALSVRGVRWRLEAIRTGRPFAEVVLLHCLVYRVEQLFLVHHESGLLVQQVVSRSIVPQDPDQVAAMLTAIDAFAGDVFKGGAHLDRVQVGDLICWIEHGSRTSLVAVVRGVAPESYAEVLRNAEARIEREFCSALATYSGDEEQFLGVIPILESCLQSEIAPSASRPALRRVRFVFGALCLLAAVSLALHWREQRVRAHRFQASVAALEKEPGIVITRAHEVDGRLLVEGLRDPIAPPPETILARAGRRSTEATFRLASFYSVDPRLLVGHAVQVLRPPPSVAISLASAEPRDLLIRGSAPHAWLERARVLAQALPGVHDVEWQVAEFDPSAKLAELTSRMQSLVVLFPSDSAELDSRGAGLDGIARTIQEARSLAQSLATELTIDVVGHADPHGAAEHNRALRMLRAERVIDELSARGVPAQVLRAQVGPDAPEADTSRSRCGDSEQIRGDPCARRVEFHVDLRPALDLPKVRR